MKADDQLSILNNQYIWYCSICLFSNLPCNHYINENEFRNAIYAIDHFELHWDSLSEKHFNPFDFKDNESDIPLDDGDPDLNFYNKMFGSFSTICNYHDENSLNDENQNDLNDDHCPLSMCHINIRSKNRNVQSFEQ